ncbi:hypothetical protein KI387_036898, partial [Taxus chinensis]
MMTGRSDESLVEDEELQYHVLLTLGKRSRETPHASDDSTSKEKMRTMGMHLIQLGYISLMQDSLDLE